MKTASWVILAVVGTLTLVGSLFSVGIAYFSVVEDKIGPATLTELSAGRPELATAVRARRATAAAYGAGFATLFLAITLGPYRRGDVWAWKTLLAGMLVVSLPKSLLEGPGSVRLRVTVPGHGALLLDPNSEAPTLSPPAPARGPAPSPLPQPFPAPAQLPAA